MKKNKQKIKTVGQLLKESDATVDDLLNMKILTREEYEDRFDIQKSNQYDNELKTITKILSEIVKHENILGAMAHYLLKRFNDLADMHLADLDFEKIDQDRREMYQVFEKNK